MYNAKYDITTAKSYYNLGLLLSEHFYDRKSSIEIKNSVGLQCETIKELVSFYQILRKEGVIRPKDIEGMTLTRSMVESIALLDQLTRADLYSVSKNEE